MKLRLHEVGWRGRRLLPRVVVSAALALAAGCATVYTSTPGVMDGMTSKGAQGAPSELIYITTTGYYFLWTLPIFSGDLRWDEKANTIRGGTRFFRDMVGVDEIQTALLKYAETRNCDVVDVAFHDSDTSYAGASYGGIVGVFFASSQIGASCVLVPRATEQTQDKAQEKGEGK